MVAVLAIFIPRPALGLPAVPGFLAALTGGAALVHTSTNVTATTPPQLTTVSPSPARIGDEVTVARGADLLQPGVPDGQIDLIIGGSQGRQISVTPSDPWQVKFVVPPPPRGVLCINAPDAAEKSPGCLHPPA